MLLLLDLLQLSIMMSTSIIFFRTVIVKNITQKTNPQKLVQQATNH